MLPTKRQGNDHHLKPALPLRQPQTPLTPKASSNPPPKPVASETNQHPRDWSTAAIGAAMDNAARWYDTLRRHDLFTVDDHAKMDELRITADRAAGEAEPPKAKHA